MNPSEQESGAGVTAKRDAWPAEPKTRTRATLGSRRARFGADRALVGAVALLPAASAGITYALSRRSRRTRSVSVGAGVAAGLMIARWQLARVFTPQPVYEVERRIGQLEIRRYSPMVVAETTLSRRNWDGALEEGFRRLAGYIFGANTSRQKADRDRQSGEPAREKLPMSAPVTTLFLPAEEHTVAFVMPDQRDVASLPVPRDDRIHLRSLGARSLAALRFSGSHRRAPVRQRFRELMEAVERSGWRARGEPSVAAYDPPTTLPFLRRNEVWVEVEPSEELSAWLSASLVKD